MAVAFAFVHHAAYVGGGSNNGDVRCGTDGYPGFGSYFAQLLAGSIVGVGDGAFSSSVVIFYRYAGGQVEVVVSNGTTAYEVAANAAVQALVEVGNEVAVYIVAIVVGSGVFVGKKTELYTPQPGESWLSSTARRLLVFICCFL